MSRTQSLASAASASSGRVAAAETSHPATVEVTRISVAVWDVPWGLAFLSAVDDAG